MSLISNYNYDYKKLKFDSYNDLHELTFDRLINLENNLLKNLSLGINKSIIEKNDLYNIIQELIMCNKVLVQKLKNKHIIKSYIKNE